MIGTLSNNVTESLLMDMEDLDFDYFLEDTDEIENYNYLENI